MLRQCAFNIFFLNWTVPVTRTALCTGGCGLNNLKLLELCYLPEIFFFFKKEEKHHLMCIELLCWDISVCQNLSFPPPPDLYAFDAPLLMVQKHGYVGRLHALLRLLMSAEIVSCFISDRCCSDIWRGPHCIRLLPACTANDSQLAAVSPPQALEVRWALHELY